jgi:hypothetical protein
MKEKRFKKGLSLPEVVVACSIAVIVMTGVYMLTQFVYSTWKSERSKSYILGQLEVVMERIQKELRATDINKIVYYPADAVNYSALSFPIALDNDGDGFIEVDASDKIIWDETVIYHTYVNAQNKVELRRTIFDPRTGLSDAQRQQQLNEVVQNGTPVAGTPEYSSWNSTGGTKTLLTNDNAALTISPTLKQFDGYASSVSRSDNVTFGSVPLTAGDHYITFAVTDKNSSSIGYKVGVDSFSVSPSGCAREAEETPVYGDSGAGKVNEEMVAYGSWSGNKQLEYQAAAVDDYMSLSFYYDQWLETNFATSLPSSTIVEYDNRTGDGTEEAGSNDYVTRLGGCGETWEALLQTGASSKTSENVAVASGDGVNFRNVILSRNIDIEGRAIKITFDNTQSSYPLAIDYAGIMVRDSGPDGDADTAKQITFNDAGGGSSIAIPAGMSMDSDWIDISDFEKSNDYLLTFHVQPSPSYVMTSWPTPAPDTQDDHSYIVEGDATVAQDATWSDNNPAEKDVIYGAETIDVSYFSSGTLTSQIYDTTLDNPSYGMLTWNIAKNNYGNYSTGGLGASLIIKVRSNDDKDALKASADWTAALSINTLSAITGSASVSGIGNGRYVQFQAQFFSQPTPGKSDYLKSCVLKNVSIKWPGADKVVDMSGYFTRRPDYGIFSVKVDDKALTKGLEIKLDISENIGLNKTVSKTITAEADPRNTGR